MNRLKESFYLAMIIIGLLALSFHLANAQVVYLWESDSVLIRQETKVQEFGWITDSIIWVVTDTTFEGDCKCEHDWVLDVEKLGSIDIHFIFGFEVMDCTRLNPDGKHCNEHQSATREKICRKCLFSVIEREKWFQRYVAPPKSEFERLKEKQMDKR